MSTQILMPALSLTNLRGVMARPDRAIQLPQVLAACETYARLGGPLLRAMTVEVG